MPAGYKTTGRKSGIAMRAAMAPDKGAYGGGTTSDGPLGEGATNPAGTPFPQLGSRSNDMNNINNL